MDVILDDFAEITIVELASRESGDRHIGEGSSPTESTGG